MTSAQTSARHTEEANKRKSFSDVFKALNRIQNVNPVKNDVNKLTLAAWVAENNKKIPKNVFNVLRNSDHHF